MDEASDPDRPMPPLFPGRTGKGIRVAVIDSGIHPGNDHIDPACIEQGVAILADGTLDTNPEETRDRLGHGTAVTAAILEKAPQATCLPVRVFRDGLRTSAAALVAAIAWSVERKADIINLSLGTTNPAHLPFFAAAVAEAHTAGIAVVSALGADGQRCLPGAIPGVIAVGLDWHCPRARLGTALDGDEPVLCASGYPRAIVGVPRRRNIYGISFAVAQVTGFAALASEGLEPDAGTPRYLALHESLRAAAVGTGG